MTTVHSYPPTQPHRIMTSTRAHTEPVPSAGGFMRSVIGHRDMDDMDDGIVLMSQPERRITQEEQDELDAKARKRAMRNLVSSWQERLQLISVITTFFASTEAAMLVNTKPATTSDWESGVLKASNASLLGALIVHVYAAILSFLGAFLLTRFKLKEATREEMIAEGIKMVNSPLTGPVIRDVEQGSVKQRRDSYPVEPPIISAHPHLEQVGPFMSNVSSHLLSRTHGLCVFLAAAGFVLAIIGILCYAWASQPREVSIFASTCLGGAVLAMGVMLI